MTDELAIRVYSGGDLEQSHAFHFDFVDKRKRAIMKPSDVGVYTEHGVEVFAIFESLSQSTGQAPWVMQASNEDPDGQTTDFYHSRRDLASYCMRQQATLPAQDTYPKSRCYRPPH